MACSPALYVPVLESVFAPEHPVPLQLPVFHPADDCPCERRFRFVAFLAGHRFGKEFLIELAHIHHVFLLGFRFVITFERWFLATLIHVQEFLDVFQIEYKNTSTVGLRVAVPHFLLKDVGFEMAGQAFVGFDGQ